jgi:hypothetical protein
MGPRSDKRGNVETLPDGALPIYELQWGRAQMNAESRT